MNDLSVYCDNHADLHVPVRYNKCPFCNHNVSAKGFVVTRTPKGFLMWCHRCHSKKFVTTGMPSISECIETTSEVLAHSKSSWLGNILQCSTSNAASVLDNTPAPDSQEITYTVQLPSDCTDVGLMPVQARLWLAKYGITLAEINKWGFCYSPIRERLILPVRDASGNVIFWQGRYFGHDASAPKYHNVRSKRESIWFDTGCDWENAPLITILCEDILSAIAINRENGYRAIALLGCYVSDALMKQLQSEGRQVLVWLDPDKRCEAMKYAKRLTANFGLTASAVVNPRYDKDPKEYSPALIKELVDAKVQNSNSVSGYIQGIVQTILQLFQHLV